MPDHLHALISFAPDKSISSTVKDGKRFLARTNGIFWQEGFFDHRLRDTNVVSNWRQKQIISGEILLPPACVKNRQIGGGSIRNLSELDRPLPLRAVALAKEARAMLDTAAQPHFFTNALGERVPPGGTRLSRPNISC